MKKPPELISRFSEFSDNLNPFVVLAWHRFGKWVRFGLFLPHIAVLIGVLAAGYYFDDPHEFEGIVFFGGMLLLLTSQVVSFSASAIYLSENDVLFCLNDMSSLQRFHGHFLPQAGVLLFLWILSIPFVFVGASIGFPVRSLFLSITIPPLLILAVTLALASFFAVEKRSEKERGRGCGLLLLSALVYIAAPVIVNIIWMERMVYRHVPPWSLPPGTGGYCWLAALLASCIVFYLLARTNIANNRNRAGREAASLLVVHMTVAVLFGILWNIAFY